MYIGAESRVRLLKDSVVKERVPKGYRLKVIDESLRKSRTRREAKILAKLSSAGFPCPKVQDVDTKSMKLTIERIEGERLVDSLESLDYKRISVMIGENIAKMHEAGVVHGDLTTSNMILSNGKVFFIDFGLSVFSEKVEDRAVDLHLLRQALDSKHYTISDVCFRQSLESYGSSFKDSKLVLKRLAVVESRGRNKQKH